MASAHLASSFLSPSAACPSWLTGERALVILSDMLVHREEAESLKAISAPSETEDADGLAGLLQIRQRLERPERAARESLGWFQSARRTPIGEWALPSPTAQPATLAYLNAQLGSLLKGTEEDSHQAAALPWAALSAWAEGLHPEPGETWAELWPARLSMSPSQVGLDFFPVDHPLTPATQTALEDALRGVLGEDLAIHRAQSGQLYLAMGRALHLQTAHPSLIAGRHLPAFEPEGEDARLWRRASNAVQMAWHALHHDTTGRRSAGDIGNMPAASLSSQPSHTPDTLWLWGAGALSTGLARRTHSVEELSANKPTSGSLSPRWLIGLTEYLRAKGYEPAITWIDPRLAEADQPALAWWTALQQALETRPSRQAWLATDGGFGWLFEGDVGPFQHWLSRWTRPRGGLWQRLPDRLTLPEAEAEDPLNG